MIRELIRDPNAFMEEKVGQLRLRWEFALLILIGAFGSVGILYVSLELLDYGVSESANFVIIGNVLSPILGAIAIWLGYTIVVHVVANQYGGRGPIRRLLKLTPYAMLPIAIGNLAKSGALYWLFSTTLEFDDILQETTYRPADAVLDAGYAEPIYMGAVVVGVLMILWTGYIFSFAVKHAKGLSHEEALRVAAVPVIIHVAYIVGNLV